MKYLKAMLFFLEDMDKMSKNQTLSLDNETVEQLSILGKKIHISKSALIRILIRNYSQNYYSEEMVR